MLKELSHKELLRLLDCAGLIFFNEDKNIVGDPDGCNDELCVEFNSEGNIIKLEYLDYITNKVIELKTKADISNYFLWEKKCEKNKQ